GTSAGYAFVQYKNMHDAKNATEKMNRFQLAGRPLQVEIKAQPPPALLNAMAPGVASPVVVAPTGGNFTAAPANAYEERLEDPVGGNLNQISRVKLMHKLARTEQPTSIPVTDMLFSGNFNQSHVYLLNQMFCPNIPTATSRSVLLKNMFNPEEETEPGWDSELRDDVKSECEEKYGPVLSIAIEKDLT
ncbi:linker between RRM2 and RRM3 domains in RBM39 protein-domain-containing protein, partial [Phakopsora pachyrhizi]